MRVLLRSPRLGTVHGKETHARSGDVTAIGTTFGTETHALAGDLPENRIGSRGNLDASDSVSVRHDSGRKKRKR